jgi:hypothetical protein
VTRHLAYRKHRRVRRIGAPGLSAFALAALAAPGACGDGARETACVPGPQTLEVNPAFGSAAPGAVLSYGVRVRNGDGGHCAPRGYALGAAPPPGFSIASEPSAVTEAGPGQEASFSLGVASSAEAGAQVAAIPFAVTDVRGGLEPLRGQVTYEVATVAGCQVRAEREILIRDVSVVDDPQRTTFDGPAGDPRTGAWTFGRLARDLAPTPEQAPELVERLLSTWLEDQTVNGFLIPKRPSMQEKLLSFWPRRPDGRLDLERLPLRLLAIANRIDLRDLARGNAGEGRFVFGVIGQSGRGLEFTFILEYKLPAATEADLLAWAHQWHALAELPFPSAEYNDALQAITDRFAGRGAAAGALNGSTLSQLRTNEFELGIPWEFREFHLGPDGFLHPAPVAGTPDISLDNGDRLARYINANENTILAERHVVPESFEDAPFVAGAIINDARDFWAAPGVNNPEVRHKFSLNTCNGCHGAETGTKFLHIRPRGAGTEAALSEFMTGVQVADPVDGRSRRLGELDRRAADLRGFVCAPATAPPPGLPDGSACKHATGFVKRAAAAAVRSSAHDGINLARRAVARGRFAVAVALLLGHACPVKGSVTAPGESWRFAETRRRPRANLQDCLPGHEGRPSQSPGFVRARSWPRPNLHDSFPPDPGLERITMIRRGAPTAFAESPGLTAGPIVASAESPRFAGGARRPPTNSRDWPGDA